MSRLNLARIGAWLAGLWAGALLALALLAAPASFAVAPRDMAGRMAGRMFAWEAYLSLAVCVILVVIVRSQARAAAHAGRGSVFSVNVLLVLAALFCTVAGYFAIQPMMVAARTGEGALSFGVLHAVSTVFFGLKTLAALGLAWRLTAGLADFSRPPSS